MNLCSDGHEEVCYECHSCPVCDALAELADCDDKVTQLEDELAEEREVK